MEYGIFNDEGCIEDGFFTYRAAEDHMFKTYDLQEEDVYVSEICPDHEGQDNKHCEECDCEQD